MAEKQASRTGRRYGLGAALLAGVVGVGGLGGCLVVTPADLRGDLTQEEIQQYRENKTRNYVFEKLKELLTKREIVAKELKTDQLTFRDKIYSEAIELTKVQRYSEAQRLLSNYEDLEKYLIAENKK